MLCINESSWRCKIRISLVLALSAFLYVGSYLSLSRPAIATAKRQGAKSFFFVSPNGKNAIRFHYFCGYCYFPLIAIDAEWGSGFIPSRCPGDTNLEK
jgi:hypothetical protein